MPPRDSDSDLKPLVRRSYVIFFQDGLWDIFLGLFVLGWGLSILTDLAYLAGSLFVCLYLIVWSLKRWLTYPRVGYARLGVRQEKFRQIISIILGITMVAGVMFAVIFIADDRPEWLTDYFPLLFSGILAAVVGVIAAWLGVYRFLVHAALIFIAGAVHQFTDIAWSCTYIGGGVVIVGVGVIYLVRFLKKYPRMTGEEIDVRP
ncbi:MAG: hypothetical protein PVG61_04190 [Dehalococcoidia bacterium]|jgi:hypothetical protein